MVGLQGDRKGLPYILYSMPFFALLHLLPTYLPYILPRLRILLPFLDYQQICLGLLSHDHRDGCTSVDFHTILKVLPHVRV